MNGLFRKFCAVFTALSLVFACAMSALAWDIGVQWNLSDDGYGMGVSAAWERGLTGSGIRIAIIDSGVNANHEDLQGVDIIQGYNIIDQNTDTSDRLGHGTLIAGIIAANSKNEIGISGICDGVTVVPIKCFDSSLTNVKHIVTGIYMAVDEFHCDVINLSLGVSSDSPSLREAVDYAVSSGVIIVSAVGNSGETDPSQLLYPAAYEPVIGVGAHGRDGAVCPFSHINSSVFVTAPGDELESLDNNSTDAYHTIHGTSFAAAEVSAMAVIAKSYDNSIDATEFQALLKASAVDAGAPGFDPSYGYGRVSMPRLLQALDDRPPYRDTIGHWAQESIAFCTERGLLSGIEPGIFSPDSTLTRAMMVSILWRMEGTPAVSTSAVFRDVQSTAWFAPAVLWANENGIVSGYGDGTFSPDSPVTREQLASIFYRYASYQGCDMTLSFPTGYSDWSSISLYAAEPFAWAVTHGILRGKTSATVDPHGQATRAESAAILRNYLTVF